MVLGQVMVDDVAEPVVHDGLLVQCGGQAHRHPAEQLGACGPWVDDAADREDAEHAGHAYLGRCRR